MAENTVKIPATIRACDEIESSIMRNWQALDLLEQPEALKL